MSHTREGGKPSARQASGEDSALFGDRGHVKGSPGHRDGLPDLFEDGPGLDAAVAGALGWRDSSCHLQGEHARRPADASLGAGGPVEPEMGLHTQPLVTGGRLESFRKVEGVRVELRRTWLWRTADRRCEEDQPSNAIWLREGCIEGQPTAGRVADEPDGFLFSDDIHQRDQVAEMGVGLCAGGAAAKAPPVVGDNIDPGAMENRRGPVPRTVVGDASVQQACQGPARLPSLAGETRLVADMEVLNLRHRLVTAISRVGPTLGARPRVAVSLAQSLGRRWKGNVSMDAQLGGVLHTPVRKSSSGRA